MSDICGKLCALIRTSSKEATRFAMCRLPAGHNGAHSEVEGDYPIHWQEVNYDSDAAVSPADTTEGTA